MGRLLILVVVCAGLAASATVATAAPPAQVIVTKKRTIPRHSGTFNVYVLCPEGYVAVAGYGIQRGREVNVWASYQVDEGPREWTFQLGNYGDTDQEMRFEVRCVKVPATIRITTRSVEQTLSASRGNVSFVARCRRGYGPVGAGFTLTGPPKAAGSAPPQGAFVHTGELIPVRGGFRVRVANPGLGDVRYEHQSICVERRDPGVRMNVVRSTSTIEVPAGEILAHTQRCPRGSVATVAGWSLMEDSFVLGEPVGFSFRRALEILFLNGSPDPEQVEAHALCLSFTRIHN